jgi:hypothetical protein
MTEKDPIADLCERMDTLRLRYTIVFTSPVAEQVPAAPPYIPLAETIAQGLADQDAYAATVAKSVVGWAEMTQPTFWGTPLGRLMFTGGCFPSAVCSQTVAAVVLGCSRQWVSAMLAEGKLTPAESRGVLVAEVQIMLAERAKRLEGLKTVN